LGVTVAFAGPDRHGLGQGRPARDAAGWSQLNHANSAVADGDTVCSDTYGNQRGGDITYVGPCDSSALADTRPGIADTQNNVTI